MRNFQQNLLIGVALGLCGLCVYQWYGQTVQRREIQKLEKDEYESSVAIQSYTNSIKIMDGQIAEMDARISKLKAESRTNADLVVAQKREIVRLGTTAEGLTNEVAGYKTATASLQAKLKEAYDGIQKQNDAMKELATQRDEFVKKYNDEVKDRNDVVSKYNDLVRQVETNQAANARR
jgi:chromosome segregation ATPase